MHKTLPFVLSLLLGAALCGCSATGSGAAGADTTDREPADTGATGSAAKPAPTSRPSADAAASKGPLLDGERWAHFGAGVHEGVVVAAADVLQNPSEFSGEPVRVEGSIVAVCQQKGCWARVGTEQDSMMVRFKDYAFFLPLDAHGTLVMEGVVSIDEVSVAERKHYLEDEGKDAAAAKITEPAKEVRFMASGVAIARQ